jgi:hypothetical protein
VLKSNSSHVNRYIDAINRQARREQKVPFEGKYVVAAFGLGAGVALVVVFLLSLHFGH